MNGMMIFVMNRSDFLKTMAKSLADTVKVSIAPIVEEKTNGLEKAARVLTNYNWQEITIPEHAKELEILDYYFEGNPVFLVYHHQEWKAYRKICSRCQSMIHINLYEKQCSCFACDMHTSLKEQTGELSLMEIDMIKQNSKWYIGLPK